MRRDRRATASAQRRGGRLTRGPARPTLPPVSTARASLTSRIRRHYDRLAPFYRRFWGEHVHHGCWNAHGLTPAEAQERLIETLAEAAAVPRAGRVLDVGCGFGGSARWLARHRGASVLGWTLSRVQARAALTTAQRLGVRRVLFAQADAETWPAREGAFDVVWIVECLEHLRDKTGALASAARSLRPGGTLALCTWMAGTTRDALTRDVANAFLCPSLATFEEHVRWTEAAGLHVEARRDLTDLVRPTWDHVRRATDRPWVRAALPFLGRDTRRFVRGFDLIARAYDEGSLVYGLLVGRRA